MSSLTIVLTALVFTCSAADSPAADQPRRPTDEELADIAKELKSGMDGYREYKRLAPSTQELTARIKFRLSQLRSDSLPDDVHSMLLEWDRVSKDTNAARKKMEDGFRNAVGASLRAFSIRPGDGKSVVGGPFDGKPPEWKPEITGESDIAIPSPNSVGIGNPGPRVIGPIPSGRLGTTEANGEIFVTPEGLALLGQFVAKGRDAAAAGYLGLILYHESLHYRKLTTKGWHRAYEVDEKEVRAATEGTLSAFFDPEKDKDVIQFIRDDNARQRSEARLPELTGGLLAGHKGFGTPTFASEEDLAAMKVLYQKHREGLESIAQDQFALKDRLSREQARRQAEAATVAANARSAQEAYERNRIPPSSIPRTEPVKPVRIDTVEILWRIAQKACSNPSALTQEYLRTWWHLLPPISYDESIGGSLQGCERTVFLRLLQWKSQGVNRIDVSHVEGLLVPAPQGSDAEFPAERRRGAPSHGGVDYNHCIDPGRSCIHR